MCHAPSVQPQQWLLLFCREGRVVTWLLAHLLGVQDWSSLLRLWLLHPSRARRSSTLWDVESEFLYSRLGAHITTKQGPVGLTPTSQRFGSEGPSP